MAQDPASVRYFNPGAMYPGPSSRRFGSDRTEIIGGGHQIAVFPDAERGAAAQFDLLSRNYSNMTLADALRKWSGGNSSDAYIAGVAQRTGLTPDTVITPAFLQSPQGLSLVRSMAQHEAGRPYPMSDEQWVNAQRLAFGALAPTPQPDPAGTLAPPPAETPNRAPESNSSLFGALGPTSPETQAPQAGQVAALMERLEQLQAQARAPEAPVDDGMSLAAPPRLNPVKFRALSRGRPFGTLRGTA